MSDEARLTRRRALLAMTAVGAGFAWLAPRPVSARRVQAEDVYPWSDVARWTVRLPNESANVAVAAAVGLAQESGTLIEHLPPAPGMVWGAAGVETHESPREVVRSIRQIITQDLSQGKVHLTGGWVMAQTEWILLQLAAGSVRSASHAS